MATQQIVGVVLVVAGLADALLAAVLAPRLPDAAQRRILSVSLLGGAALLVLLGVVLLVRA